MLARLVGALAHPAKAIAANPKPSFCHDFMPLLSSLI
jgi:hypothetical protein